jgi:hypothetical protein
MEIIITAAGALFVGYMVGRWTGVVSGYHTAHREKYGKIFNLEIDETDPTNLLCYDLLNDKFLFQVATAEAAIEKLGEFLPENTTIVVSRVVHEPV